MSSNRDSQATFSTDFLTTDGELGKLIRAHDWAATLGPPQHWSQGLQASLRLILATHHPAAILWGPDNICLYNDSFASNVVPEKHPAILGATGRMAWRESWEIVEPQIRIVMHGQGATWREDQYHAKLRNGALEEAFWSYSYSPIDDAQSPNGIGGVLIVCEETTAKVIAQRHQALRQQLDAALRDVSLPAEIMAIATTLLGELMGASRCGYGEVDNSGDFLNIRSEWTTEHTASLVGRIHLSEFGPRLLGRELEGQLVPIEDPWVAAIQRQGSDPLHHHRRGEIGLAVPLIREGRFIAALYLCNKRAVGWSQYCAPIIRDVAERVLDAIERARASIERDRITAALRDSEARYRSLVEASAAIVWEMPASGEFVTEQPGWSAFTGQSFEQLKGWGWLNAVHPEDQDLTAEVIGHAFETCSNYEVEYRLRGSDGRYRPMRIRAVTVLNSDGSLRGWIGIHSDAPAASVASSVSSAPRADTNTRLETTPHVIWTATPEGRLEHISERWREWTGLRNPGDKWVDALHPDERGLVTAALKRALNNGTLFDMEHRIRRANGEYRWAHARAQPIRDAAGRIMQWAGTIEDIHDWLNAHDIQVSREQRAAPSTQSAAAPQSAQSAG